MSHPAPSQPVGGADPSGALESGRSFQHYEILRREDGTPWELGRGAMGITYKAFDVNLCCEVALKVVNAALLDHPNARERFVREARAAAALRHRNVASVYHLGNDGERFFYAMEFIDGETLDALVRRQGPLPVENTLRLILQAARALAAADRQGLVHRDIKPANLMVVHEDDDDHMLVKVIDFGLARPASGGGTSTGALTIGGFVGTPQFASPEQLEEKALDIRADIYSLGVTAWFLLTGRAPFTGSLATICQQHLTKAPPWEQMPAWLPAPVRRLLGQMLEKDPARRPQNAVELRREIEGCLEAVRLHPLPTLPRTANLETEWRVGTVLQGRYELVRELGNSRRGRVFEGRNLGADGDRVTITALLPELFSHSGSSDDLSDEVRLIQASTHPHLTRLYALERSDDGNKRFLVEEWMNGGTLADLLAARNGVLPVPEGLRLLGQAAAAVDHAVSRRLKHLDLAIHEVSLHIPASVASPEPAGPRESVARAMNGWLSWSLKVNPLGAIGEHTELDTWAGEVTLVPGMGAVPGDGLAATYLRALAALIYELLGGAPGSWRANAAPRGQYISLPALNEAANGVLRQPFVGEIAFASSRSFYEALARAADFDPLSLQLARGRLPDAPPPSIAELPVAVAVPLTPKGSRRAARKTESIADESRETAFPARRIDGAATMRPASGSAVPYFMRGDKEFAYSVEPKELPVGSISDRLTLVDGEPSPVGRWFFSVAVLLLGFVLAVAGVWIVLAQRLPSDDRHATVKKAPPPITPQITNQEPRHRAASTPRLTTPPPLPAVTYRAANPSATLAALPVPGPADETMNGVVRDPVPAPSTTLPGVAPAMPALSPKAETPQKLVNLRVKSVPSGATIQTDGRTLGTTPLEIELPVGPYELIARFDGWPETHETIILGEDQSTAATEIHLMPPGLVPASELPSPPDLTHRPRHAASAPVRATIPQASIAPAVPEVRRALPPLTPFDPDGPTASPETDGKAVPASSPAGD